MVPVLCPLHQETRPSFYVNTRKDVFYCHGCGQGGDLIRFVQLSRQVYSRAGAQAHHRPSQSLRTALSPGTEMVATAVEEKIQLKENIASYSQPRSHGSVYWPLIGDVTTIDVATPARPSVFIDSPCAQT
jgi:CHC2 zinc finger